MSQENLKTASLVLGILGIINLLLAFCLGFWDFIFAIILLTISVVIYYNNKEAISKASKDVQMWFKISIVAPIASIIIMVSFLCCCLVVYLIMILATASGTGGS